MKRLACIVAEAEADDRNRQRPHQARPNSRNQHIKRGGVKIKIAPHIEMCGINCMSALPGANAYIYVMAKKWYEELMH